MIGELSSAHDSIDSTSQLKVVGVGNESHFAVGMGITLQSLGKNA